MFSLGVVCSESLCVLALVGCKCVLFKSACSLLVKGLKYYL